MSLASQRSVILPVSQQIDARSLSDLRIVAAVNDDSVLRTNLLASPIIAERAVPLIIERGHLCAGAAYAAATSHCSDASAIVFAHQDVYLPRGWEEKLFRAMSWLDSYDPKWAVLGVYGVRATGEHAGRVWSSGLGKSIGEPVPEPIPVVSVDELVIVIKCPGPSFDSALPSYHLYGTDIVQAALASGRTAYVFDGPVIHNSKPVLRLNRGYFDAYRYVHNKWLPQLPLPTSVMPVTRYYWPLLRHWMMATKNRWMGRLPNRQRSEDPAALAAQLGYEVN